MSKRKFLNNILSVFIMLSLVMWGKNPANANTFAATDETRVPHYFGPYPNWANSPQALANAVVTIEPAANTPGAVGNSVSADRAFATDFETLPAVVDPSVTPLATRIYNVSVGSATGGTFTLTVDAITTGDIAFDAAAVDVQGALTTAGVTATVSGSAPWVVVFDTAPTSVSIDGAGLTQAVTDSAVTSAGVSYDATVGSANGGTFTLTVDTLTTAAIAFDAAALDVEGALTTAGITATVSGSAPWVITFTTAPGSVSMDNGGLTFPGASDSALTGPNSLYNVAVGSATGGTFTLTVDTLTTAAIAFDAVALDVEGALTTAGVTATVSGSAPWVVTFSSAPTTVSIDGAGLTQGVTDASATGAATDMYEVSAGNATGGTFTLTVDGTDTSADIAFNAAAGAIEAALLGALPTGVTATVIGTGPWTITFATAPTTSVTVSGAGLTYPVESSPIPTFVVIPSHPLPAGMLETIQTWNQAATGGSTTPSAGRTFHAYVLRLTTGTTYEVVFDSGELTVPALTTPGVSEIATFDVTDTPVLDGDLLAFYGAGIPYDAGLGGTDKFSNPVVTAPVVTDSVDTSAYSTDRTYSFSATVRPTALGVGAEATASVDPTTGGVTEITVTNPGSGYTQAPLVTITAPGLTITNQATAESVISTGSISSITVVESGFGFTTPTVTLSGGNPTTPATAEASGGVDWVTVTDGGSGYTPNATVQFGPSSGVTASGHLVLDANGSITEIVVDNPGSGYTSAPPVTIEDLTSGFPTTPGSATATINITRVNITAAGAGYETMPTVTIADSVAPFDKYASATAVGTVFGAVTAINVTNAGAGYITPGMRKFVDTLPGLGEAGANNLGQYIPIAVPDTTTYPGSDYYVIGLVQYREQMHSDLPATLLRGYVQLSEGPVQGKALPLTNALLDGTEVAINGFTGVDVPHYLGPAIVATKDRPVRIKFHNLLPTGIDGNLFIPVDTSLMGAGAGPNMMTLDANGVPIDMEEDLGTVTDGVRNPTCGQPGLKDPQCFSENRATLHLHGGITPWISDGTPHQWITPAGENTDYPEGVSVANVPDMNGCEAADDGCFTLFYTNQQSARLMFYHDHAWGITRLNVYAGEAAAYLITDDTEKALFTNPGAPFEDLGIGTPLVVQDKTFVPSDAKMAELDPTWQKDRWGGEGNLWVPHVYMPAQNPSDLSGMSEFGRWMYGPWFWPPAKTAKYPPISNPYYDPACNVDVPSTWQYQEYPFCEPPLMPSTPNISVGMEAFNDTPLVNGTAYPTTTVDPKAYRFRWLNAANDRFFNLSWYVADPRTGTLSEVALNPDDLIAAVADPNGVSPAPDETWSPKGPDWIVIGTEGGFLPKPVVVPAQPTTWITDGTVFNVGNVDKHSLLIAPAERFDTIVDFSQFRGKTLILYNDAPAAFPARVGCYDYYTGGPDLSPACAPTTLPGYGPNTRTVMQVKVSNAMPAVAFDRPNTTNDRLGQLETLWAHQADGSGVFESGQDPIIVGQADYNSAYGTNFASNAWCNSPTNPTAKCDGFARIMEQGGRAADPVIGRAADTWGAPFKFDTLSGDQVSIGFEPKAIHDEMNSANFDEWGRMTANLGLEAPGATPLLQNIILYPYNNPATEILNATNMPSSLDVTQISAADINGVQIWKITHNGVDTHPVHFHLYDVQVLNRVTWDNIVQPPDPTELGWKDTVRVSPLEDTIVAVRPIVPAIPFGVPNSERPLNPMMPIGARGSQNDVNGNEAGFNNTDALGNAWAGGPIVNEVVNFAWEYVYHCHILSHEEMDMMRPQVVHVTTTLPDAPVLDPITDTAGNPINLIWSDGTPVDYADPTTWEDPKNEIGYRIERSSGGAFVQIGAALANQTSYVDNTTVTDQYYEYRVVAYNVQGDSTSNVNAIGSLTPPLVNSSVRISTNPNNFGVVWFTVTFSEPVVGVDSTDFTLTTTGGITGATVIGAFGNSASYNVAVYTGAGSGTLRLDLVDDDTILDATGNELGGIGAGNGNFITGEAYTIDKTGPTVVSSVRLNPSPTTLNTVWYSVTFSEPVMGVDASDFTLSVTGATTGASVNGVYGSGATRTVAVNAGTGDGTLRLDVTDDDSIADYVGNKLGGTGAGNGSFTAGAAYTFDRTGPTTASSVRLSANPTTLSTLWFSVTFNEPVLGVDASDFALTTTGSITGASVTGAYGSGTKYNVAVNSGTGSGTIRLDVADNDSITDYLGNRLGGTGVGNGNFITGEVYTIDRTAPMVVSSVRLNYNPTALGTAWYLVTFSEPVVGVGVSDFALTTTGITGASVSGVYGSGAGYYVTVNTGTGNGTLRLDVVDDDSIADYLANKLGGVGTGNGNFSTGEIYTVSKP